MNHRKNLEYLYALTRFGIKTGLGNIRKLCTALGNPQDAYPVIHVSGTNGKGTTCAMINSVLTGAGLKVGLYTSPHLVHFGERVRVGGSLLSDEEASKMIDELRPLFDETGSTFFESTTAMAFLHFARKEVDIAVIETGLGGKLDSTNIVNPMLAIFTPISFDHTERLGSDLPAIASDKAGIIKYGCVVVSSQQEESALEELKCRAKSHNCEFHYAPDEISIDRGSPNPFNSMVDLTCSIRPELSGSYNLPFPGSHQWTNLQTSLAALILLKSAGFNLTDEIIKSGLEKVEWRGRLEVLCRTPLVYYDVAHNPAAAKAVTDFFREVHPDRKVRIIMGIVKDKDVEGVLGMLASIAEEFTFVDLDNPRGMEPESLLAAADGLGLKGRIIADPSSAIKTVLTEILPDGIVLIVGSHYLGEAIYVKDLTKWK